MAVVIMEEILRYLQQEPGFSRLMDGMWDLYARHGRLFGAVRLIDPFPVEERAISEFFKRDYYDQALIRISLADFERQLKRVFEYAPNLGVLLEAYFKRPLMQRVVRAEPKARIRIRDSFTMRIKTDILPFFEGTEAELWLREMIAHTRRTYKPWSERFVAEPQVVAEQIKTVCSALNTLPQDEYLLLSDFSEQVCGDARALDFYGSHGALFMRALARKFGTGIPAQLEDSIHLYWQAGLLSNGVLNQVTVSGLLAYGAEADAACAYYDNLGEAHVLTLENISRFTRADAYGKKVFVLENADVFALLCEQLRGVRCTLICAAAGMNAALDRLLSLCTAGGAQLYYSGNMDMKGLTWGDMLYLRFHKHFTPWRYEKEDFELALNESGALLPDDKKELSLHNETFASMLSMVRKKGKTAGHLPLVQVLAEDIKTFVGGEYAK